MTNIKQLIMALRDAYVRDDREASDLIEQEIIDRTEDEVKDQVTEVMGLLRASYGVGWYDVDFLRNSFCNRIEYLVHE